MPFSGFFASGFLLKCFGTIGQGRPFIMLIKHTRTSAGQFLLYETRLVYMFLSLVFTQAVADRSPDK